MTRKDYVRIANALGHARRMSETENQRRGVDRAAAAIAVELAADNPAFRRQQFLDAVKFAGDGGEVKIGQRNF